MKRLLYTIVVLSLIIEARAGGIVTNTNQSAAFIRMLVRDASTEVDALYFNPAGLVHLEDGLYVQLNTQTIWQTRTIQTDVSQPTKTIDIQGKTFVPLLPTGYVVYKHGPWAVGAGFEVIGGGGSVRSEDGLPEFHLQLLDAATNPEKLARFGTTTYSANMYFEGSSAYYGAQFSVAYALTERLSVSAGIRRVVIHNRVKGHLRDISFDFGGGPMIRAVDFFDTLLARVQPAVEGSCKIVDGVKDAGLDPNEVQLVHLVLFGRITPEQKQQLEDGLRQFGYTDDQINEMSVQDVKTAYLGIQALLGNTKEQFVDRAVDVRQTGSGWTPIVGIDYDGGNWGLAIKYEHKTPMTVVNNTIKDDFGFYPDGREIPNDMPAMLSVGLRYQMQSKLHTQLGFHYYFDKAARYGRTDDNNNFITNGEEATIAGTNTALLKGNTYEIGLGAAYQYSSALQLSAGLLAVRVHPNPVYQNATSYALSTLTFGTGLAYLLNDRLQLQLAGSLTLYEPYTRDFGLYSETYDKSAQVVAFGLTYKLQ